MPKQEFALRWNQVGWSNPTFGLSPYFIFYNANAKGEAITMKNCSRVRLELLNAEKRRWSLVFPKAARSKPWGGRGQRLNGTIFSTTTPTHSIHDVLVDKLVFVELDFPNLPTVAWQHFKWGEMHAYNPTFLMSGEPHDNILWAHLLWIIYLCQKIRPEFFARTWVIKKTKQKENKDVIWTWQWPSSE